MAPRPVNAVVWRQGSRWVGRLGREGSPTRSARSRRDCVARLRRDAGTATLTVEVVPDLVGVSEAADILGWDKRRVFTYISRGSFPDPVALLASGRVWRRQDVEAYAKRWRRKSEGPSRRTAPRRTRARAR